MIILTGFILVPDSDYQAIKNELVIHARLTLAESGCLNFNVTPDAENMSRFNVYEEFVDQAAFEHHQARVKSSKWGEITHHVERHYQVSERV